MSSARKLIIALGVVCFSIASHGVRAQTPQEAYQSDKQREAKADALCHYIVGNAQYVKNNYSWHFLYLTPSNTFYQAHPRGWKECSSLDDAGPHKFGDVICDNEYEEYSPSEYIPFNGRWSKPTYAGPRSRCSQIVIEDGVIVEYYTDKKMDTKGNVLKNETTRYTFRRDAVRNVLKGW